MCPNQQSSAIVLNNIVRKKSIVMIKRDHTQMICLHVSTFPFLLINSCVHTDATNQQLKALTAMIISPQSTERNCSVGLSSFE